MTRTPLELGSTSVETLDRRSRQVCVVYPDHRMPAGTTPGRARIGIERAGASVHLLVDHGLRYDGEDAQVRAWIRDGRAAFPDLVHLIDWLRSVTPEGPTGAPVPAVPGRAAGSPAAGRPASPPPREVTDLVHAVGLLATPDRLDAERLRAQLGKSVVGQAGALDLLAPAVARHVAKRHPRRPLAAMLVGPTGVGKTETARTLARTLVDVGGGDQWGFVRFDMAEFTERFAVSRLVGAPPGYVGYGDPSLATRLAENPHLVVLFDEIDRAHPQVIDALMNLMDAGRLDSAQHGEIQAERAVLLFTSNLGAAEVPAPAGGDDDAAGRAHLISHGLAPQLVGRFGVVAVFRELTDADLVAATAMSVTRVCGDYGMTVRRVAPAFVAGVVGQLRTSRIGVRGVEHLLDAQLGPELGRVDPAVVDISDDGGVLPVPPEPDAVPVPAGHDLRSEDDNNERR